MIHKLPPPKCQKVAFCAKEEWRGLGLKGLPWLGRVNTSSQVAEKSWECPRFKYERQRRLCLMFQNPKFVILIIPDATPDKILTEIKTKRTNGARPKGSTRSETIPENW
ncbi:hypothetical protein MCOR25_000297 [Pyricularia grisea]|nr:hypothetical protein MCOR25_000297 [Pyricularia grisea]